MSIPRRDLLAWALCAAPVLGCREQAAPPAPSRARHEPTGPRSAPDAPAPIASAPAIPRPRDPQFPDEFQITAMQGMSYDPVIAGNTLTALRAAHEQGVRFVEVDFFTTSDGVLVSAHDPGVRDCGDVRRMTSAAVLGCRLTGGRRVASLEQLLQIPFDGIYIDLKETKQAAPGAFAVHAAAKAIVEADRRDDAVVMVYQPTDEIVEILRQHRLRGGIKGYPESQGDTERLVQRAADQGLEMICVNARHVTPELIVESAAKGVWHLPWSLDSDRVEHWRALARAGVGGMIVQHYRAARDRVAPVWVDVRTRPALARQL